MDADSVGALGAGAEKFRFVLNGWIIIILLRNVGASCKPTAILGTEDSNSATVAWVRYAAQQKSRRELLAVVGNARLSRRELKFRLCFAMGRWKPPAGSRISAVIFGR